MPHSRWLVLCWWLLVMAVAGETAPCWSQAKQPAPGAKQPKKKPPPPVLLKEPQTAEEYFRAALLMHQLARPGLARHYLEELMKLKPNDATLLRLRDKFGPSDFVRLSLAKELQPVSEQLLQRVNAAVRRRISDPKYVDTLLDNLSGDPGERKAALIMLRNIGPVVVPRFLQRIATEKNADRLSDLQAGLIEFGRPAVAPLTAALDSPNLRIRTSALTVLGYIGETSSVPYLWYPAFAPREVPGVRTAAREALARILKVPAAQVGRMAPPSIAQELLRLAVQHFRGERAWKRETGGRVSLWYWDSATGRVQIRPVTARFASLYVGTRFARQSLEISAENPDAQALFLAMSLSAAADPTWKKPLPTGKGTAFDAALSAGPQVMNRALKLALQHGDPHAAIACLLVLRQIAGKADLRDGEEAPPIVQALQHPEERVRFAAAVTVLNIDPRRSFRGISRVVPILARALNDGGSPTGLVVYGNVQRGVTLAGLLGEMGFAPRVATTGREGYKIATSRSNIHLILLHANTIRWPLTQTVANLRADARTADIPIAVFGPASLRERVQRKLHRYRLVTYVVESSTGDHLALQLRPLLARVTMPPLSPQQRAEQRKAAAYWLAYIASKRSSLYDLSAAEEALENSVTDADVAENVVLALAAVPGKEAQQTLHSVVINPNMSKNVRLTAAAQLTVHIQQFGLLLGQREIGLLRQLHAATADAELRTTLSALQGVLRPDRRRVGEVLRTVPLPRIPANPSP